MLNEGARIRSELHHLVHPEIGTENYLGIRAELMNIPCDQVWK